jgi:hypothetical protein
MQENVLGLTLEGCDTAPSNIVLAILAVLVESLDTVCPNIPDAVIREE